jgi:hypothetical protein
MRTRRVLVVVVFLSLGLASPAAEPGDAAQVEKLIAQLGSKSFAEREKAMQALEGIGEPALGALRKASRSGDIEISRRAVDLVRRIEDRDLPTRALLPKRVHVVCKDTPVPEAVAELARKSGYDVIVGETRARVAARKVTLDTGETTFWKAFDQLCSQAGLAEAKPESDDDRKSDRDPDFVPGYVFGQIILEDDRSPRSPTWYAGAVRIRAMSPDTRILGPGRGDGEILCALEVFPEPRLAMLLNLVSLHIDKAVDDQGQALTPAPPPPPGPKGPVVSRPLWWAGPHQVVVRLRQGEKASRSLKELKGRLGIRTRTAPEELLTVENIQKAAGKVFKGSAGGALNVIAVSRDASGVFELEVKVALPAGVQLAFGGPPLPPPALVGAAPQPGQVPGPAMPGFAPRLPVPGLTLRDGKGERLPLVVSKHVAQTKDGLSVQHYTLTCQLQKGQEPDKLVVAGSRLVTVDVPFTLKDVPLR